MNSTTSDQISDDRTVGNRRWPRDSYKLINGALTRLMGRLQRWNTITREHGASSAPYESQLQVIQGMVEWGNKVLDNKALPFITVDGITVSGLRYIKAALILDAWQIDKRAVNSSTAEPWPPGVSHSVNDRMHRSRQLAEDIPFPPADVLDEFRHEHGTAMPAASETLEWDVFVSHASEDKEPFVDPFVSSLTSHGVKAWYDSSQLSLGDSLRRTIDKGLSRSRFGVVVLSPSFFAKEWPRRELDGLVAREVEGHKVILPVWHNVSESDVRRFSPMLADRLGISSSLGISRVVDEVLKVLRAT